MKYKTTAKAIRNGSMNPRCAGYCDLSYSADKSLSRCLYVRRVWMDF